MKATLFGSMMQAFNASEYAGKRIRYSANLKVRGIEGWGGLWMRVDDANHLQNGHPSMLAFDNMHDGAADRSMKGTAKWRNEAIVLDVPPDATSVNIGLLLHGPGAIWVNGIKVEVAGPEVPVAGQPIR